MMDIQGFAQHLRSRGLHVAVFEKRTVMGLVRPPLPPGKQGITVTRFAREVYLARCAFEEETVYLEDVSNIELVDGRWSFWNEAPGHFGGFNLDGIQCFRPTLDDLLPVVENYYFRPPVVLCNWILPVYQHPRWTLEGVESAVNYAKSMTYEQASAIRGDYLLGIPSRPPREVNYEIRSSHEIRTSMDDLLFYHAQRVTEAGPLLYLRYDCGEALTCIDLTPAEKTKVGELLLQQSGILECWEKENRKGEP